MWNDLVLMAHPTFGALAILTAVWTFVEALDASNDNGRRIRIAALTTAGLMWVTYIVGGYWYVTSYAADKARILSGPWPFAHSFFMETKEHVFFGLLLLATFLPIVVANNLLTSRPARQLTMLSSALIVLLGLAMEGSGAFVSMGVKLALIGKVS